MARFVLLAGAIGLVLFLGPRLDAFLAPDVDAQNNGADHAGAHVAQTDSDLVRAVRNATEPFLDPVVADNAGYKPKLGCVSGTLEGAMGVHYIKGELVGDGKIDPEQPEALMYEMRNGKLFLLGVEYIVFAEDWFNDPEHKDPPALMGQLFTYNESPNRFNLPAFYALHVWAWRDNPHGTFVDWNPQVSCDGFKSIQ